MKLSKLWVPGVVLLCGSGLVMAAEPMDKTQGSTTPGATMQGSEQGQIPEFSTVDTDKSGDISSTEALSVPALVQQFSAVDRNADGELSEEEYAAIQRGKTEDEGS